ncbi:MAG TPA: LuxR family transcriptional regulator [Gammaproteobacteria bacterium]
MLKSNIPNYIDELDYFTDLANAKTTDDIHALCGRITRDYGYDNFAYVLTISNSVHKPDVYAVSNYSNDWLEHYVSHQYMGVDPIIKHCLAGNTQVVWSRVFDRVTRTQLAARVMQEAGEFGLKDGVTFPIHGAYGDHGLLSFSRSRSIDSNDVNFLHSLAYLYFLSVQIHETAYRIFSKPNGPVQCLQLSGRQHDCLSWAAEGKTNWEIAQILNLSESTVKMHIAHACQRLGVFNKQQAVAKAISLGLIGHQNPILIKQANIF